LKFLSKALLEETVFKSLFSNLGQVWDLRVNKPSKNFNCKQSKLSESIEQVYKKLKI
jgi:hypothetical protein